MKSCNRSLFLFILSLSPLSVVVAQPPTYNNSQITCEEVFRFQSRCTPAGSIQSRVGLNNKFHTGEVMQISIDSIPHETTVSASGLAKVTVEGFGAGTHVVELIDPVGCYPPITITCQTGVSVDEWEDDVESSTEISTATALLDNYPDPFNPQTTIRYKLSKDALVSLKVYNMLGQVVATLVDEIQPAGYREAVWNGSNDSGGKVASGIYIYRMTAHQTNGGQAGNFMATKRMLLLK